MGKIPLETIRSANAVSARDRSLTVVATGGTNGIGEFTIRTIAKHYSQSRQSLRVYVVGRNAQSAARIISDCREIYSTGDFRFVQASDLSLIRDADAVCREIERQEHEGATDGGHEPHIDLLIMSHCDLHFGDRRETLEGLDKTMSMLYHSRMRIAMNLLPLLRASDQASHVISIFGAGLEKSKSWNSEDLLLRQKSQYSMDRCRTHSVMMKTMFMEHLAEQNAGKVAFVHVFPGLVITPAFKDKSHPWWFKVAWAVLGPIAGLLIAISPEEIGERILFLTSHAFPPKAVNGGTADQEDTGLTIATSTYGDVGGGAYACGQGSEAIDAQKLYATCRKQGIERKVLSHTMQVFQDIVRDGIHKG